MFYAVSLDAAKDRPLCMFDNNYMLVKVIIMNPTYPGNCDIFSLYTIEMQSLNNIFAAQINAVVNCLFFAPSGLYFFMLCISKVLSKYFSVAFTLSSYYQGCFCFGASFCFENIS